MQRNKLFFKNFIPLILGPVGLFSKEYNFKLIQCKEKEMNIESKSLERIEKKYIFNLIYKIRQIDIFK